MAAKSKDMKKRKQAEEIGQRIKQARLEMGASQEEVSHFLGVTPRSIQAYEQGEAIPYRHGEKLSEFLGRPVAWFWNGEAAVSVRDEQMDAIHAELKELKTMVARLERVLKRELGRVATPA